MGFADVAKGLISVGEGFVILAEKVVDFAEDFLKFVKGVVAVGSQILQDVADWAAKNLFELKLLELSGKLDNEFNACVGMKLQCVIVGLNIDYSGKLVFLSTTRVFLQLHIKHNAILGTFTRNIMLNSLKVCELRYRD